MRHCCLRGSVRLSISCTVLLFVILSTVRQDLRATGLRVGLDSCDIFRWYFSSTWSVHDPCNLHTTPGALPKPLFFSPFNPFELSSLHSSLSSAREVQLELCATKRPA
jgi:hypothetical protein